ncbi:MULTISPECIES: DUF6497 family protein [unclassified Sulfitobacter]|jgi:hypothetical protein|uniref:DUF6497 family protein n=1 Tax=unclassified Sulfitobacter TaxID=196795 RepID=UPI0015938887|nr:DUF6497 family protein [Sulfitobacter sp. HGT1]
MKLAAALILAATSALAVDVPSGQPVDLQEVLVDQMGDETWLRFRFIAPQIARNGGTIGYDAAGPDMKVLCDTLAIPYMAQYALTGDVIVISLADRAVEFGAADAGATQFFEAYRLKNGTCIWEAL